MKKLAAVLIALIILTFVQTTIGCNGGEDGTPTPSPIVVPTFTPTPVPTPSIPTYSQVIQTYPPDVKLCKTECSIKGSTDEQWLLEVEEGQAGIEISNSQLQVQCYGTKVTLKIPLVIDGIDYPSDTKLTVDKDMEWIEVSSWD